MGFKEENYTHKGLRYISVYFMVLLSFSALHGQNAPHCPVRVDFEPRIEHQSKSANSIKQNTFPFFNSWDDLDNIKFSDDEYAHVSFNSVRRSTMIEGSNLSFKIPDGAEINGIELIVEGHTTGEGHIEGNIVQLLNYQGQRVGSNYALEALPEDRDWLISENSTDFVWRYGGEFDDWGTDINRFLVTNPNFGYSLQVRNKLANSADVFIDHIRMIVHFIPLYNVCSDHACVPFYVAKSEDPLITYEWFLPQGFELLSDSEHDYAINIGPSYATFGTYEICAESFYDDASQGVCCRKFNYTNCNPGQIEGTVFLDKNGNFKEDNGDDLQGGILINLYDTDDTFIISTTTGNDGRYSFPSVPIGEYYIEVVNENENLVFVAPNIGSDTENSDIDGSFGNGTSNIITITPNLIASDIDAGLSTRVSIGDFVWEDNNGDGIQQAAEPGIPDVQLKLTHAISGEWNIKTDDDGFYQFDNIPSGQFLLSITAPDEFSPTVANSTTPELDSDFDGSPVVIALFDGGSIDTIDAGFLRFSSIGDFVWEDTNMDGVQDTSEIGIPDALIYLHDDQGAILDSTRTDGEGLYLFDQLLPGTYTLSLSVDTFLTLTPSGDGTNPDFDSNGIFDGTEITTLPIVLESNENVENIDFGFFFLPVEIMGATWIDSNNDGIFQIDEPFFPNIAVSLFDINDSLISVEQTDETGIFSFTMIPSGSYYLGFELPEGYIFTLANIGDDLLNSDVDNTNGINTTNTINLNPGEIDFTNAAGYQALPKVGDFVWLDDNRNGIQDIGDQGINGVTVSLFDATSNLVRETLSATNPETGEDGYYLFDTLAIGEYYIQFSSIDSLDFTIHVEDEADQDSDVNGENGAGTTSTFSLVGNSCNLEIDAGYAAQNSNISGEAWVDSDFDGIQNPDDLLLADVNVDLFNESNVIRASTTTDSLGRYTFNSIEEGNYYIVFTPSDRYISTDSDMGADELLDSDVNDNITQGSTDIFALFPGIDITGIDVGLIDGVIDIDGFTWIDDNGDGINQGVEIALSNAKVVLFDTSGTALDSMITGIDGYYNFENNIANRYYLTFDPQDESFINTQANQGSDDDVDDDVTSAVIENSTAEFDVIYFDELDNINAGFFQLSSIGDMTFIDLNENGVNDAEPGLDRVLINLLDSSGGILQTTETMQEGGSDSGFYLFQNVPPGEYQLQYIRPLFYQFVIADVGTDDNVDSDVTIVEANEGKTEIFSISSGTTQLQYDAGFVFRTPAESSISGLVWDDLNMNGLRDNEPLIENILIELTSADGTIIDSQTTDQDGTYSFMGLQEGFYSVKANLAASRTSTFPNVGIDDSIDSDFFDEDDEVSTEQFFLTVFEDMTNLDLGTVPTLDIGDFVWLDLNNNGTQEANEEGVQGIQVSIMDINNTIADTTITDEFGNYIFENIPTGTYKVCVDLPEGLFIGKKDQGVEQLDSDANPDGCTDFIMNPTGGSNLDIDFAVTENGSIEGVTFVDLNGNGIQNLLDPGQEEVEVSLFNSNDILIESTSTITIGDTSAFYSFTDIPVGDYYVVFTYPENFIFSDPNVGPDDTDSDVTSSIVLGSTDIITIGSGQNLTDVDAGAFLPACIGSFVWEDENQNGLQDETEEGVEGIQVIVFRSFGIPFDTVTTNEDGIFKFSDLKQGLYFVQFVIPQQFTISPIDVGNDDSIDSDADETGKTPLISLAHGANLTSLGCGIFESTASLRSVVWEDLNGDGERQVNEARIPDIRITLYNDQGQAVNSTTSNSLGLYAFQEIPVGNYNVFVDLSDTEYTFTDANMTGDDMFDSDIMPNGESEIFASAEVLSVPNVDVGLYEGGNINGIVWNDVNQDGIFNLEEPTLSGITASLYTADGEKVKELMTEESDENMVFDNINPGSYFIKYTLPENTHASISYSIMEDDNNSDIVNESGDYMSPIFIVKSGRAVTNIDAGFYEKSTMQTLTEQISEVEGVEVEATDTDNNTTPIELSLSIHPNPAAEYIRITTGDTHTGRVKVLNAQKKVIIDLDITHLESIDLKDLLPGIYYVSLESGGKSTSKKLIKIQ